MSDTAVKPCPLPVSVTAALVAWCQTPLSNPARAWCQTPPPNPAVARCQTPPSKPAIAGVSHLPTASQRALYEVSDIRVKICERVLT
ncbi:MAG: hypothetical protein LBK25_02495 [Treponema sp.]|nr:hypothetical protein [Treponema sp.]